MRRLRNCTTGEIVAQRVAYAVTPWRRTIGFLLRRMVEPSEGLWFRRCAAIHTVGVRAALDVIFLDRDDTVVRVISPVPRNRIVRGGPGVAATLELGSGATGIRAGDRLRLE